MSRSHLHSIEVDADESRSFALPPAMFLRLSQVLRTTGLSRSTVYKLIADQRFPAPCSLGARAVGWRSTEVLLWCQSRPVKRQGGGSSVHAAEASPPWTR